MNRAKRAGVEGYTFLISYIFTYRWVSSRPTGFVGEVGASG